MTALSIGTRVETPHGSGRVVGWHQSESRIFGGSRAVVYAVVELDHGGRRLSPVAEVTPERDAGEGRQEGARR
jgi:hypothetical protein